MNALNARAAFGLSLEQLSPRELEVASLAAAHKSTKEISAELGISPGTVTGYIASARAKWEARDRNELARIFLALSQAGSNTGGRAPSISGEQFEGGDEHALVNPEAFVDLPESAVFRIADVLAFEGGPPEAPAPAGLEALDERFGKAWRVFAVPVLAVLFGLAGVCMLTIAKVLSDLL